MVKKDDVQNEAQLEMRLQKVESRMDVLTDTIASLRTQLTTHEDKMKKSRIL